MSVGHDFWKDPQQVRSKLLLFGTFRIRTRVGKQ